MGDDVEAVDHALPVDQPTRFENLGRIHRVGVLLLTAWAQAVRKIGPGRGADRGSGLVDEAGAVDGSI